MMQVFYNGTDVIVKELIIVIIDIILCNVGDKSEKDIDVVFILNRITNISRKLTLSAHGEIFLRKGIE